MPKFTSLEGHLYVNDIKEAFAFYGKALGMVAVPHHGYDILTLNGEHFFSIFESPDTPAYTSSQRLKACVEVATSDEVKEIANALASGGGHINDPPRPLPWSPCAVDLIDKYGIAWFISTPCFEPPKGCLACVPVNEKPGCDICIRWENEGFSCPKI
jgi:PhnB protein